MKNFPNSLDIVLHLAWFTQPGTIPFKRLSSLLISSAEGGATSMTYFKGFGEPIAWLHKELLVRQCASASSSSLSPSSIIFASGLQICTTK